MNDEPHVVEPEEEQSNLRALLLIEAEKVYQWLIRIMEQERAEDLPRATPPREKPPKANKF